MDIKKILSEQINIEGISQEEIYNLITGTANPSLGDFSLPCFRFAKALRKSPVQIANDLKDAFGGCPVVSDVQAVNGYLNFFVDNKVMSATVLDEARQDSFGKSDVGNGKTICIDYSSINIAKPFHIGHLGTTAIGGSLYKLYKNLGYNVIGINHLGDWGTQFGKLIVAYDLWGDKEKIEQGGVEALQEIYVKFHQEEVDHPELTEQARAWFAKIEQGDARALELFHWFKDITLKEVNKIYKRLNVTFDSYNGESFYNDKMQPVLDELESKGLVKLSDGAKIVDLEEFGMAPCLLVKADGATLYATRDLAAAFYRKNTYDFYKSLYVVAYQQNLHFKQFFKVLELMGHEWAKDCIHVAYGMVSLAEGSMSTRKGNVVWLSKVLDAAVEKAKSIIEEKNPDLADKDEVAEKIGVGAVMFSALQNGRIKDITFSLDKVLTFEGETCPYLQYTYARTNSVLIKAGNAINAKVAPDYASLDNAESKELIKLINRYPDIIVDAAEKYEPSILAKYLIDLAQAYNKFYFEHRILDEEVSRQLPRLYATDATNKIIKNGLSLLGIDVPAHM
ncbi:MAG: arginine--tRNA ligase [Clostridia bacterium]|nr:arginine--tRNA ligase [Clostridia bacterium]